MREKMKIAIIGCGRFSPFFVPLFKADPVIEEVFVCDLIRERAEKFAKDFDVKIIDTYEEALASFDKSVEAGGNYDGIHYNRGVCLMSLFGLNDRK